MSFVLMSVSTVDSRPFQAFCRLGAVPRWRWMRCVAVQVTARGWLNANLRIFFDIFVAWYKKHSFNPEKILLPCRLLPVRNCLAANGFLKGRLLRRERRPFDL
jgi:hypothetical protein